MDEENDQPGAASNASTEILIETSIDHGRTTQWMIAKLSTAHRNAFVIPPVRYIRCVMDYFNTYGKLTQAYEHISLLDEIIDNNVIIS